MSNRQPIGFFDSGVGGLSVWRELLRQLPHESSIYLADSANCPYGPKSLERIVELSRNNTRLLIEQGAKAIVIACNTATGAAIRSLRDEFPVPFIGMEPAVKPAAEQTRTGCIGVLATEGTINAKHFLETTQRHARDVKLVTRIGRGLVELVEENKIDTPEAENLLRTYLEPMLDAGADQVVLGCSHYPFLIPQIEKITGQRASTIDPAPAVIRRVKEVLEAENLVNLGDLTPNHSFYSSAEPQVLERLLFQITGEHYKAKRTNEFR